MYSRGGKTRGDNKANDHDMGRNGWRTQFLKRMVEFSDRIATPIQLL